MIARLFSMTMREHFEPGIANEESPGTLPPGEFLGIFFLFDPIAVRIPQNPPWARRPAVHYGWSREKRLDQQERVMAELEGEG